MNRSVEAAVFENGCRDILADEETLFGYYDARLPADIYQTASFETWYKRESQKNPQLLIMREDDILGVVQA